VLSLYINIIMHKKIIFIFISFIFCSLHVLSQDSKLKFKGTSLYLGNIAEDKLPLNFNFSYINNSNADIRIIDVKLPDNAKISNWNKQIPIKPNTSGIITISYSPKRLGLFNEKLIVKTNEAGSKEITLSFGGEVMAKKKTQVDYYKQKDGGLSFIKKSINFGDIKEFQKKTDTIYMFNSSNKSIKLESPSTLPVFVSIQFPKQEIEPNNAEKLIITYNAALRHAYGKTTDTVFVETNDEVNPAKAIYITADIFEDFSKIKPEKMKLQPEAYLVNTNYDFRLVKKGVEVKTVFNLKNKGKTQLVIRKIDKSCECIKVNYADKIRFDRDSPFEIIMNTTNLKGNVHETITLITNDPKSPRIVLHIMGIVD
jgi:hypothetical protein